MSPFKEPEHFAPNSPTVKHNRHYASKENYLKLFEDAGNAVAIGEASTSYLWDPDAPDTINGKLPNAKIIAILRNPIQRAFSDYLQDRYLRNIRQSFEEALKLELDQELRDPSYFEGYSYVRNGFYSPNLAKYYSLFGKQNVKVVVFEEFTRNTKEIVNEILEFLEVQYRFSEPLTEKHNGFLAPRTTSLTSLVHTSKLMGTYHHLPYGFQSLIAKMYKSFEHSLLFKEGPKEEISTAARQKLREIFLPEVKRLENMLLRELPWTDFKV
jgi:hypothetical protein